MTILRLFVAFFLVSTIGVSFGQLDSLHIKSKTCFKDSVFHSYEEFDLSGRTTFYKFYENQSRHWSCGTIIYTSSMRERHHIDASSLIGYVEENCLLDSTSKPLYCIQYFVEDDQYYLHQLNYLSLLHPFSYIQHFTSGTDLLNDSSYQLFLKTRDTTRRIYYEYSAGLNLEQEIYLDKSGDTMWRYQYRYDSSNGLLSSIVKFWDQDRIYSIEDFLYDQEGRVTETTVDYSVDSSRSKYIEFPLKIRTINCYDGTFLLERKIYEPIDTLYTTHLYEYNFFGQLISETITNLEKNEITVKRWTYEYY